MTKQELQHIFESPFNWDNWRKVMDFVFPEFQYALQQQDIPLDTAQRKRDAKYIKQHGVTELSDGERIVLYEIALSEKVRLDRNVKSVRKLISSEVFTGYQIGLGVFHNEDKTKWRFTLVIREFTSALTISDKKPESYTYVFGEGERGRTAAERFFDLSKIEKKKLKDLEVAFSVEALSKKFFTQYKEVYLQFVNNIVENPSRLNLFKGENRDKVARDFVKKMMGRIVFLYFLQKKGWMGCKTKWLDGEELFMQQLFEAAPEDGNFYMQYLQPLFFDTLNAKRTAVEEDCIIGGTNFGKVPFLNGGLFEREENHPDNLTLDWEIFNRFFEILNSYNFTIIEDDPDFKEVAVDPEMLGHIFENLLEDNKDKGAFYTPKEIVQYMCQESLIEYLHTALSQNITDEKLKDSIRDFVIKQHFVGLNDIHQQSDRYVLQALRNIKVCDPAIGSGAFPMGILQEIFRMVEALEDRDIFQTIWKMEAWDAARVKADIIQNSIYGVDIEKGAVDIARLRFWLSIIIDEETPKPLPNLDYKIMQGNSLLERFGPIDLKFDRTKYEKPIQKQANLFGEIKNPQISIAEAMAVKGFDLAKMEQEYFHTEDPIVKERIRKEITDFEKSFIKDQIKAKKDTVIDAINTLSKKLRAANYAKLSEKKKDEKLLKVAEVDLVEISNVEEESKQIKEGNKPYFLWNLYFMDVFDKDGFDIVIGNPPYIQLQKMGRETDVLQKAGYETFTRTGDIYCLFFELGNRVLLKSSGNLNFITSNSWLRANYGKITRAYFLEKTMPVQLIDLSDSDIFETATVRTSIFLFKKGIGSYSLNATRITRKKQAALNNFRKYLQENSVSIESLSENAWVVNNKEKQLIISTVRTQGKQLFNWDIEIFRGIVTGLNDAFIVPDLIKRQIVDENHDELSLLKPLLRGRDISRYAYSDANQWIIATFPSKAIDIENYPTIKHHLLKAGMRILNQSGEKWIDGGGNIISARKKTSGKWFETQDSISYWENFELPKIIYANMSKEFSFSYDDKNYFTNQKCFILTGEKLKYLLGILNSKLFKFCFEEEFPEVQGNAREINKVVFKTIPIKYPNDIEEQLIEEKVNAVLKQREKNQDSARIEKEIDFLVYKIYGLSYEQVEVIEDGSLELTEEEYSNLSLVDVKV